MILLISPGSVVVYISLPGSTVLTLLLGDEGGAP